MTATVAILFGASLFAAMPTPVEIWTEGDAHEVQRLADGVKSVFRQSPHFVLSYGGKPQTVYVYIPAKVSTRLAGGRVGYSAEIQISYGGPHVADRLSSLADVRCWEDDLIACGRRTLAVAEQFRPRASDISR